MNTNAFTYKGYLGSSEISLGDDCLHGRIQFIHDLITYEGQTPKELYEAFTDAVDRYLAYCQKTGKPADKPFSGTFNVRITADLHKKAAVAAKIKNKTLNEYVRDAIQNAVEQNGTAKVEHVHKHIIAFTEETVVETVVATMQDQRLFWGTTNAKH